MSFCKYVEVDLDLLGSYDPLINENALYLMRNAKVQDPQMLDRLRSVPGIDNDSRAGADLRDP